MIFVTVGTHHDPFTRLVNAMDSIAGDSGERVIIQRGLTPYDAQSAETFDFRPREEIIKLCQEARVIVTHAGIGSIIEALNSGTPLIVVPRLKRHGEHNTDHQLDLARAVEKRNWGRVILDVEELAAAQNVQPMQSTDEWAADIFKTDDELDAFLEDLRASRNSSIA